MNETNLKSPPTATSLFRKYFGGKRGMIVLAVLVALLGYGTWKYVTTSSQPWLIRWRLGRYLKTQAHTSDFKVPFTFPSKAEMSLAPPKAGAKTGAAKGKRTGKDMGTLLNEYYPLMTEVATLEGDIASSGPELKDNTALLDALTKRLAEATPEESAVLQPSLELLRARVLAAQKKGAAQPQLLAKQQALEPIVEDLWEFQRTAAADAAVSEAARSNNLAKSSDDLVAEAQKKIQQASSYTEIYKLIGQELWVAKQLLESANPVHRREGVSLALAASRQALNGAQNGWVAARICEGYIWPNLDLADDTNRRSEFNLENLTGECVTIFQRNEEYSNVIRIYESILERPGTPQRADWARSQIGVTYDQAGNPKLALKYLKQIQSTNDYRFVLRRVPRLEQQLKAK